MENGNFGVPSLSFLPARNFKLNVSKEVSIVIPNAGDYESVVPDEEGKELFNGSGNFEIFNNNSIDFIAVSKVLFATKQYPDLKDNELFVPTDFVFKMEDNQIVINGRVVALE